MSRRSGLWGIATLLASALPARATFENGGRALLAASLAALIALSHAARGGIAAAPDITADLSGVVVHDRQVAVDDLAGGIALQNFLGSIPAGATVDAYHDDGANGVLFSTDTRVSLPGSVLAGDEDVVRLNGGVFSLVFDGSALGVPAGVGVDAVARDTSGNLILSFDTTANLGGVVYPDEDLVRFDDTAFSSALDLSALGLDTGLDTDAAAADGPGVWALSFDSDGVLGGVTFADEDVVRVSTSGPSFSLFLDASSEHAGWAPADLNALPEPSGLGSVVSGAVLTAALVRVRGRCPFSRRRKCECDRFSC